MATSRLLRYMLMSDTSSEVPAYIEYRDTPKGEWQVVMREFTNAAAATQYGNDNLSNKADWKVVDGDGKPL